MCINFVHIVMASFAWLIYFSLFQKLKTKSPATHTYSLYNFNYRCEFKLLILCKYIKTHVRKACIYMAMRSKLLMLR